MTVPVPWECETKIKTVICDPCFNVVCGLTAQFTAGKVQLQAVLGFYQKKKKKENIFKSSQGHE